MGATPAETTGPETEAKARSEERQRHQCQTDVWMLRAETRECLSRTSYGKEAVL